MPMDNDPVKVIIANSDTQSSAVFESMFQTFSNADVLAVVRSENMLMAKLMSLEPDLVLLCPDDDLIPLTAMDRLKETRPQVHVIIGYPPGFDPAMLVEALEAGAYECVEKPDSMTSPVYSQIRLHMLTMVGLLQSRNRFFKARITDHKSRFFVPAGKREEEADRLDKKPQIICIAASTGGPEILSRIFSLLPADLTVPILLVQHIPARMTRFFAQSLDRQSELNIGEACHGESVKEGNVYIAPGGQHMVVSEPDPDGRRTIELNTQAPVKSVRPSADVLFESISRSYRSVMAIVLTGMGEDGCQGIVYLKQRTRCVCITQAAQTCVVYGMPRSVDEADLSDEKLDPLSIAHRIVLSQK